MYKFECSSFVDGSLDVLQLCVPLAEVPQILKTLHDDPSGGHLGSAKTLYRVKQKFNIKLCPVMATFIESEFWVLKRKEETMLVSPSCTPRSCSWSIVHAGKKKDYRHKLKILNRSFKVFHISSQSLY